LERSAEQIDDGEIASVERLSLEKVKAYIRQARILDGKTLIGLTLLEMFGQKQSF
jgi:hypothetical protein